MAENRSPSSAASGDETLSPLPSGHRLSRSTTFPNPRRQSLGSMSNSSYTMRPSKTRQFSRASTESLPLPAINETSNSQNDDRAEWHAFSLTFVALPALAGLFFENGGAVMTDILLLLLGCLFLYWSVKWPWQWYHMSQGRVFVEYEENYEEDIAVTEASEVEAESEIEKGEAQASGPDQERQRILDNRRQQVNSHKLRKYEMMALLSCFFFPMAVAYLLHAIRPYLSRPSGGLVSNSNLTLFTLAAEVRPILHLFRLVEARTLHLQKVIHENPPNNNSASNEQVTTLQDRIAQLEERLADTQSHVATTNGKSRQQEPSMDTAAVTASTKLALQPDLDALNRAVRRYEKRSTMQTVVLDARLRDLDNRVNDALSLAAVASRMVHSQKQSPGLIGRIVQFVSNIAQFFVNTISEIVLLPLKALGQVYMFLLGPRRKKRKVPRNEKGSDKGGRMKLRDGKVITEGPGRYQ